jgi:hypothetical protein
MIKECVIMVEGDYLNRYCRIFFMRGDFKKAPMSFGERNTRALRQSHKTAFLCIRTISYNIF